MGDETDALDLPLHQVSGNLDRGHISEINRQELSEQAQAINTALNRYYSGDRNFNNVLDDLEDLGYTDERARQIRASAQVERAIRMETGSPSNLTPNQLDFIQTNRIGGRRVMINEHFQVFTDSDGRQYVNDNRVREVDGTPARLFLPAPEQFNPLTLQQQEEQQRRIDEARPDFLEDFIEFNYPPYTGDRLTTEFSRRDLSLIDRYSNQYLSNPSAVALQNLRDNIDITTNARYVANSNEILNQYLVDIQYEANFRNENDGRPQALSEAQYMILRTGRFNWDGGNIYRGDNDQLYYYDTTRGNRRAVPDFDSEGEVFQGLLPNQIDLPTSITRITLQEDFDPNDSVRFSRTALTSEEQDRLRVDVANTINGQQSYKDFLQTINTEYQLSNQQFIDLTDYVLTNTGEQVSYQDAISTQAYVDQPLYFVTQEGHTRFTTDTGTYRSAFSDIDPALVTTQINNFDNAFETIHYAVRTSARIQPNIDPESNVLEQLKQGNLDPSLIRPLPPEQLERPRPFIRPQTEVANIENILQELATGEINPEDFVPPDIQPIFEGTTGNPPIVPGTTGSFYQLPQSQVDRYERYFNQRQNQFTPFRNMFRDFLPVFSGAIGGFFAFSLARSRELGTMQEILEQERIFLENLEVRVENNLNRLETIQNLNNDAENQRRTGYDLLERLNVVRGELAGMGDDPDVPEDLLQQQVTLTAGELSRSNARLREILNEINVATEDLDEIQDELRESVVDRDLVNQNIETLMETNRQIMQDIYRYNPQILAGIQIGGTLGLVLSGYFFPEYVDIDAEGTENFIKADHVNYNPKEKQFKDKEKKNSKKLRSKINPDITAPKITVGEGTISRKAPQIVRSFIPTKANKNGTPLTYKQIQEYKSTLSPDELNKLKGKMLIFGADEKIIKKDSICKSVQKENLITKIPIKI